MSQIRHKCIDEYKKRDYYGYIKLTGYKNKLVQLLNKINNHN